MDMVSIGFMVVCLTAMLGLMLYGAYTLGRKSAARTAPAPRQRTEEEDRAQIERYCRIIDNINAYGTAQAQKEIDG